MFEIDEQLKVELEKRKITADTIKEYIIFEDECVKKGFTFKSLLEARGKMEAEPPYQQSDGDADGYPVWDYYCPDCNFDFEDSRPNFCENCGKKIDWKNIE